MRRSTEHATGASPQPVMATGSLSATDTVPGSPSFASARGNVEKVGAVGSKVPCGGNDMFGPLVAGVVAGVVEPADGSVDAPVSTTDVTAASVPVTVLPVVSPPPLDVS